MILLALGSNRGDRASHLAAAQSHMQAGGIHIITASAIHETPALMPPGAPPEWDAPFLNQVLHVQTKLSPQSLLNQLQAIETAMGRKPAARWAPREIDLDILSYNACILNETFLTLPHPELHQRRFVLAPLAEIAPDWRHPLSQKTAVMMLMEIAP